MDENKMAKWLVVLLTKILEGLNLGNLQRRAEHIAHNHNCALCVL